MQRSALMAAADGSVLEVLLWAERTHAGEHVALPAGHQSVDVKRLVSLAEQATVNWVSASRSFQTHAAGPVHTVGAAPSTGGPAITGFPFRTAAQITASNAAVYAKLVSAAGGKAALIKGWPILQSGRIDKEPLRSHRGPMADGEEQCLPRRRDVRLLPTPSRGTGQP